MSNQILHHLTMPGESAEHRTARNKLLTEEVALRRQTESVAALRRALPAGGIVAEDYLFDANDGPLKLSDLFKPGKDTLAIYSFMYGPERELPCTGCTHFLDGLDGMVQHITQRINLAVVAKSPLPRLMALAHARGWRTLPLLSTHGNTYDHDYFGDSSSLPEAVRKQQEFKAGEEWDMPMLNVFQRRGTVISHFWGSEILYMPPEPGQEYRHNDALDSLWNMLDLTPEGRGDFQPQLSYSSRNNWRSDWEQTLKTEKNKATLEEANAALAEGNYEEFLSFCTDDTEWTFVGDRTLKGKEAVRQYMATTYIEPPKFKVINLVAEGEFLTVVGDITLMNEDGKLVHHSYCDVWRFSEEKIVELKAFVIKNPGQG